VDYSQQSCLSGDGNVGLEQPHALHFMCHLVCVCVCETLLPLIICSYSKRVESLPDGVNTFPYTLTGTRLVRNILLVIFVNHLK